MQGESVATVTASQHPGYSEGEIVLAGRDGAPTRFRIARISEARPGRRAGNDRTRRTRDARFTAYGGLCVIGKPAPGETVVVAAASGPVGSW